MTIHDQASMLAGQLGLVLSLSPSIPQGRIVVIPNGIDRGVYLNPEDSSLEACWSIARREAVEA